MPKIPLLMLALAVFTVACSTAESSAQDLVIVASEPDGLVGEPSEKLSSTRMIILEDGQNVVFFDLSGQLHQVTGPFSGPIGRNLTLPESTTAAQKMLASVEQYLKPSGSSKRSAGATRGDDQAGVWELEVSRIPETSVFCIVQGAEFTASREIAGFDGGAVVEFRSQTHPTHSYRFDTNVASMNVSPDQFEGGEYAVHLDSKFAGNVFFKTIPEVDQSMAALKLHENGCIRQFERSLLSSAQLSDYRPLISSSP